MTRRESLLAMLGVVMGVSQGGIPGTRLEPVGIDVDGKIKPVEMLSYWSVPVMSPAGRRIGTRFGITVNRQREIVEVFSPRILGK